MSSRFSISRVSRSRDSSAVARSSAWAARRPLDSVAAQRGHRRLGRGQRAAQVVADRGQQGRAGAVGLLDQARPRAARLASSVALAHRSRLGGERREQPLVGGPDRTGDAQQEPVADRHARWWPCPRPASPTWSISCQAPAVSGALEEGERVEAERLAGAAEDLRAARSRPAGCRRPGRPGSRPRPRRGRPPSYAGPRARPATETSAATAMKTSSARALFLSEIVNV